jgi:hypothetical protein
LNVRGGFEIVTSDLRGPHGVNRRGELHPIMHIFDGYAPDRGPDGAPVEQVLRASGRDFLEANGHRDRGRFNSNISGTMRSSGTCGTRR